MHTERRGRKEGWCNQVGVTSFLAAYSQPLRATDNPSIIVHFISIAMLLFDAKQWQGGKGLSGCVILKPK